MAAICIISGIAACAPNETIEQPTQSISGADAQNVSDSPQALKQPGSDVQNASNGQPAPNLAESGEPNAPATPHDASLSDFGTQDALMGVPGASLQGSDNANVSTAVSLPGLDSGYYHAAYEGMTENGAAFLACGTNGRLDRIFEDGKLESIPLPVGDRYLTSVLISTEIMLVGGESGALAYSHDGKEFTLSGGAGDENILGMAQFKGEYYAVCHSGNVLASSDGATWRVGNNLTDKPLIAVAATDDYIMTITNDTDIFVSNDGADWKRHNYNEAYEGLADKLWFRNMVNVEGLIYVLGHLDDNPGEPSVMYTYDGGESWRFTVSHEINDLPPEEFFPLTVFSVSFFGNELLAVCDNGRVLSYTDCPSCNKIMRASNVDLYCIAAGNDTVLVAGGNFGFALLSEADL